MSLQNLIRATIIGTGVTLLASCEQYPIEEAYVRICVDKKQELVEYEKCEQKPVNQSLDGFVWLYVAHSSLNTLEFGSKTRGLKEPPRGALVSTYRSPSFGTSSAARGYGSASNTRSSGANAASMGRGR